MARTRASDYEAKRREILETAAVVFANVGMEKATMAEIARRGGTSKALLYHYHGGKDALIFDIVRTHLIDLDTRLEEADVGALPAEERLARLVVAVLDHYRDDGAKHRVLLNGMNGLPTEQTDAVREIERRIVHRFATVIGEIAPELAGDRALLMPATFSLFGSLNWIYTWFRDDGPLSREEYARMVTSLFLDGVRSVR